MPWTDAGKNKILDASGAAQVALHDGYPGETGANELAVASPQVYVRQSITFSAAASGSKDSSNTPQFNVPAGTTVRWLSFWDSASPQVCLAYAPLGESRIEDYTVDSGADTIDATAHGLSNGDLVVFYKGTAPGGLTAGTPYYVVNANTNDFQVSATEGGSAINLTNTVNTAWLSTIVPEVYGSQGTFTATDADLSV